MASSPADIDECTENSDSCLENFQCVNTEGNFACICNNGFFLSSDNTTCCKLNLELGALYVRTYIHMYVHSSNSYASYICHSIHSL